MRRGSVLEHVRTEVTCCGSFSPQPRRWRGSREARGALIHCPNVARRYGFVEFDDPRDADDAVYDLNGKELCGERVIVEHTKGPRRDGGYSGRSKCSREDLLQEQRGIHATFHSFQGSFGLNFRAKS